MAPASLVAKEDHIEVQISKKKQVHFSEDCITELTSPDVPIETTGVVE